METGAASRGVQMGARAAEGGALSARDNILLALLCLAVAALGILPVLWPGFSFSPSHDTPHLTSPLFCEVGRHFAAGRFPLFDWSMLEPVSHNAHFSPLYPLYFAGLLNHCELLPSVGAHDAVTVVHLGIMALAAVLLGRAAGLPFLGAIFVALVVVASPNALALARWPTLAAPAAWLPLAAAGLVMILYRDQWLRGTAMVMAGTGLMLLAAPATNLIASLTAFGMFLAAGATIAALSDGSWRWKPAVWALCGLASAGLVAMIVTGTSGNLLLVMDDLVRWNRTGHVIGREVTESFAREILVEQQGPRELLSVILPFQVAGLATGDFFLGGITAGLAALGAWDGRREALSRTLAVMLGVILVLMYLDHFGLALAWRWIPGMSHTRHLSLLGTPFMLGAALLAGRGFVVLLRPEAGGARRGLVILLASLALLSFPFLLIWTGFSWARAVPAVLGMAALALVLHRWGDGLAARKPGRLAAAVILACGVVALPQMSIYLRPISESPGVTATWADLDGMVGRLAANDPEPGVFVFHDSITGDGFHYTTSGTAARLLGLPAFQYFHSPRVHWKFFAQNYLFPDYATYGRLGGRYVLAQAPIEHPLLEPIGEEGSIRAYRIRGARALVTPICGLPALPDEAGTPGARHRPSQLPMAPPHLMVAGRTADARPDACPAGAVTGIAVDRSVESLRFTLATPDAAVLVLNLPPYEGWRLTMGGQRLPIFMLDESRMVARVPPGLGGPAALSFKPMPVLWRMLVSVAGLGLLALFILWLAWRRPGPARPLQLPAALSALLGRSARLSAFLQTRGLRFNPRQPRTNP